MKSGEANLQESCITWFKYRFPKLATLCFAVPNGGSRNPIEAANLKRQGVTAGVSDIILLCPNSKYHTLCIEMKFGNGKQTESQKHFQQLAETAGNRYIICRSFDEFKTAIENYMNG